MVEVTEGKDQQAAGLVKEVLCYSEGVSVTAAQEGSWMTRGGDLQRAKAEAVRTLGDLKGTDSPARMAILGQYIDSVLPSNVTTISFF